MDTAVWIILAVVIIIAVIAAIALLMRQRTLRRRTKAYEIRENATQQVSEVRHREAVAEEADARARKAQAEADAKAAEARQLSEEAQAHQGHAAESRTEVEREFARADKLDPDVRDTDVRKNRTARHEVHAAGGPNGDGNADGSSPRTGHAPADDTSPATTADGGIVQDSSRDEPPANR